MVACSGSAAPSDESIRLIDVVSVTSGLPAGEPIPTGGTEIFAKLLSPERQNELTIVTIPDGFTLASDLLIDNQRAVFH
jgi:hypothetical protein